MMKAFRYLGPVALAVIAMCAVVFADDVKTDYDKQADFSHYKTYSWIKVQANDELWQQRITDAVDQALQSRGLQKVDSGGDLAVAAVGSTRDEKEYQTFYNGLGGWWWNGFGEQTTTTVQHYPVGTLVVDLYDTGNKRLVWRGTASAALSNQPSKNEKKMDKDVNKMFENFPPHS